MRVLFRDLISPHQIFTIKRSFSYSSRSLLLIRAVITISGRPLYICFSFCLSVSPSALSLIDLPLVSSGYRFFVTPSATLDSRVFRLRIRERNRDIIFASWTSALPFAPRRGEMTWSESADNKASVKLNEPFRINDLANDSSVVFRQLYRACNFVDINIFDRQAPTEWCSNEGGGIDPSRNGRPDATRPGFRIHPRAAPSRAGCVTIVRGLSWN